MKGKSTGVLLIAGLIVLSATALFVMPAVAQEEDPVLWVVPENPTRYISSSPVDALDKTLVEDVSMGTEFSGNVLVLCQAVGQHPIAEDVYLRFFVYDAANIQDITIGTAKGIPLGSPVIDENTESDPVVKVLDFEGVNWGGWRIGDGVEYLIGDIPFSGGPSITGNFDPAEGYTIADFHPENAYYYVKVPFTIRFDSPSEDGFVLYVYAENCLAGNDWAHTAYSHDAGYYHEIPEFATIAMPVASILGLLFFFNHRKRRNV